MSAALDHLVSHLALERLEENLFRGEVQDLGWGQVFGGHVLGQALSAALQTVPPDRAAHSLHAYFVYPGSVDSSIAYKVDRIRDGRSFNTRRVDATQGGHVIFSMSASFQISETSFEHQAEMPKVPGPDELASQTELARRTNHLSGPIRERHLIERPVEIRPVDPDNWFNPKPKPPRSALWLRATGKLPDEPAMHRCLLAYASDFNFLGVSMYPHGVSWLTPWMQVASLDHAMWFHRPFRADEWLLEVAESPSAAEARGVCRALFFTREGSLVASTVQEGLIRKRG